MNFFYFVYIILPVEHFKLASLLGSSAASVVPAAAGSELSMLLISELLSEHAK